MNKTVVVELDQNGKEIFHTAGYEKYWISRGGHGNRLVEKRTCKRSGFRSGNLCRHGVFRKARRGELYRRNIDTDEDDDESCRWTRVGYEIMMPDNGTEQKSRCYFYR